jgi:Zn-dependent membrane protease YugP
MFAMLPVILFGIIVQIRLKNTYSKYSKMQNARGMTGAAMAEMILRGAGIQDVRVQCIGGHLSDHFDPIKKVVSLSEEVYNGSSIAAIGIAAHECGHAIQHHELYFPIRLRSAIVGLTNFSSKLLYFLILGSFLIYSYSVSTMIFNIATICYAVLFFFQLVTLPVEFNASNRALKQIKSAGFESNDLSGVKNVLSAAAMTYVASAVTALWQLLIMLSRGRNRR